MADVLYTSGGDLLALLTTGTFRWMVAQASYVPDADAHVHVSDVTGELTAVGYSRQAISTPTRTPGTGVIVYDAVDPAFGSAAAGQTGTWLILFLFVTNDADSRLVCALGMSKPTTGGAYTPTLDPNGFASIAQA